MMMGVLGALVMLYIDKQFNSDDLKSFAILLPENASSARNVLSVIAGAMIGVAGTVFSITLVVLTLAASQFGPRLLRNFMYVTLNQIVLGLYISTFIYALIILNAVEGAENYKFIPRFSVLVALISTFVSLVYLIIFIHGVSVSIQPSTILTDLRQELERSIAKIYPNEVGSDATFFNEENVAALKKKYAYSKEIRNKKSGYVAYIDIDKIVEIAEERDVLFEINCKPGDFIVSRESLGNVYFNSPDGKEALDVTNYFNFEKSKTVFQDTEFAIHQIVEVACKALSPGINDPYTAINCIDNLTSVLSVATSLNFPSAFRTNKVGELILVAQTNTFSGFINAAFTQIRQFSGTVPAVLNRLMESLITIKKLAHNESQLNILSKHANNIMEEAQSKFSVKSDLDDLGERYNSFKNAKPKQ